MTTPDERTRAILLARDFLRSLAYHRCSSVPERIRLRAKTLLRHYPDSDDMQLAYMVCPYWFGDPEG